jgi:hypothetical protein
MANSTVRIFELVWMRKQDVYCTRGKEKQCAHAFKENHGNLENRVIKKIIILKWDLRKWSLYARYVWLSTGLSNPWY